jgi:hypothetical protein
MDRDISFIKNVSMILFGGALIMIALHMLGVDIP